MDKIKEAKEIFMRYGGNRFHMDREGDGELYDSFGISEQQERIWMEEYQQDLMSRLRMETDARKIRNIITDLILAVFDGRNARSMLPMVFDEIRSKLLMLDSLSKVIIAEYILNSVVKPRYCRERFKDLVLEGRALASHILWDVINNPITVAPGYKAVAKGPEDYLKEENILARAYNDLRRCNAPESAKLSPRESLH